MAGQQGAPTPGAGQIPVVTSILKDFSAEALGELRTWLEQNPPSIPVTQILGFTQFTVQQATPIITSETTTSATFTDLATVGPSITGLPDGKYVILFGSALSASAGANAIMGIKINSTEATTADPTVQTNGTALTSAATAMVKTLSNGGNNTLTARYESSGTGTFAIRWLIAIRYANP